MGPAAKDEQAEVSPVSVLVSSPALRIAVPSPAHPPEQEDAPGESGSAPGVSPKTPVEGLGPSPPAAFVGPPSTPKRKPRPPERLGSLMETKLLMQASRLAEHSNDPSHSEVAAAHRNEQQEVGEALFDFCRLIGRSPQSEVFVARNRKDSGLSAVKRSMHQLTSKAERQRYLHEVEAAISVPWHPNIVQYYRCWQEGGHFYVQTELCEGGSLARALDSLRSQGGRLPERDIWRMLQGISRGLRHLHEHSILHLDVKPDNIFIDANGIFKVGDLGTAVLRKNWEAEAGDGAYMAAELLSSDSNASTASDVYSLGATVLEATILADKHSLPFPQQGKRFMLPSPWSTELRDCIAAMLERNPRRRCALQYCEWMAGYALCKDM